MLLHMERGEKSMSEKLLEALDETILSVCEDIKEKVIPADDYVETVKALSALIEVRESML